MRIILIALFTLPLIGNAQSTHIENERKRLINEVLREYGALYILKDFDTIWVADRIKKGEKYLLSKIDYFEPRIKPSDSSVISMQNSNQGVLSEPPKKIFRGHFERVWQTAFINQNRVHLIGDEWVKTVVFKRYAFSPSPRLLSQLKVFFLSIIHSSFPDSEYEKSLFAKYKYITIARQTNNLKFTNLVAFHYHKERLTKGYDELCSLDNNYKNEKKWCAFYNSLAGILKTGIDRLHYPPEQIDSLHLLYHKVLDRFPTNYIANFNLGSSYFNKAVYLNVMQKSETDLDKIIEIQQEVSTLMKIALRYFVPINFVPPAIEGKN